ncbi:MAG TPA: glycosyltransferase family 1 protein [bacterium]|nr:glycosyltransferase family 1 protein [bacterium]HPT29976.1 glycosyltransferase family 1 protein [bacterium]
MTIGIDASRANREFKTGTEWYSYYLIKNLAELDQKNRYILYGLDAWRPELAKIIKEHKNIRGKILGWPFTYFWTLGRLSLEMLWRRPKLLFVPAHALPLIHPRRSIVTIHDIAFKKEKQVYNEQTVERGGKFLRRMVIVLVKYFSFLVGRGFKYEPTTYLDWSTRFALRHAKKIITVSQFTKNELINTYRAHPDKITVVHNGYNAEAYHLINNQEKINAVAAKYGLDFPYLLYVGRLEKKKNIPLLVEAFALLKERHPEIKEKLVLVGQASFGYDEIKYIVEEYNLNKEVIMPGWIEEEDLPYLHNRASAFVFPSRHEGFGIPVIQALACGLPTAVSDLPVMREVVAEAAIYFDKDDKEDMTQKLYTLLSDKSLRQELRAKGLSRASQFSWEKCARETLKVFQSVIE